MTYVDHDTCKISRKSTTFIQGPCNGAWNLGKKCTLYSMYWWKTWKYRYAVNLIHAGSKQDISSFRQDENDSMFSANRITQHGHDHNNW